MWNQFGRQGTADYLFLVQRWSGAKHFFKVDMIDILESGPFCKPSQKQNHAIPHASLDKSHDVFMSRGLKLHFTAKNIVIIRYFHAQKLLRKEVFFLAIHLQQNPQFYFYISSAACSKIAERVKPEKLNVFMIPFWGPGLEGPSGSCGNQGLYFTGVVRLWKSIRIFSTGEDNVSALVSHPSVYSRLKHLNKYWIMMQLVVDTHYSQKDWYTYCIQALVINWFRWGWPLCVGVKY